MIKEAVEHVSGRFQSPYLLLNGPPVPWVGLGGTHVGNMWVFQLFPQWHIHLPPPLPRLRQELFLADQRKSAFQHGWICRLNIVLVITASPPVCSVSQLVSPPGGYCILDEWDYFDNYTWSQTAVMFEWHEWMFWIFLCSLCLSPPRDLDCLGVKNRALVSLPVEEVLQSLNDLIAYFQLPDVELEHEERQIKLRSLKNRQNLFKQEVSFITKEQCSKSAVHETLINNIASCSQKKNSPKEFDLWLRQFE